MNNSSTLNTVQGSKEMTTVWLYSHKYQYSTHVCHVIQTTLVQWKDGQ